MDSDPEVVSPSMVDHRNFADRAAHDARGAVRKINVVVEWVLEDHGQELPAPAQEDLKKVHGLADYLGRLVDDVRSYAILEPCELVVADPTELVHEVLIGLDLADNHAVTVEASTAQDVGFAREAAAEALRRVLENAIQHHPGPQRSIRVGTEVGTNPPETVVRLTVTDDGPGLTDSVKERVFEPFTTGTPTDVGGTGMGLAHVARLAQINGGAASLVSQSGKGTTVTMTWPAEIRSS